MRIHAITVMIHVMGIGHTYPLPLGFAEEMGRLPPRPPLFPCAKAAAGNALLRGGACGAPYQGASCTGPGGTAVAGRGSSADGCSDGRRGYKWAVLMALGHFPGLGGAQVCARVL